MCSLCVYALHICTLYMLIWEVAAVLHYHTLYYMNSLDALTDTDSWQSCSIGISSDHCRFLPAADKA